MVKQLSYYLLILSTLHNANTVPMRFLAKTRNHLSTKSDAIERISNIKPLAFNAKLRVVPRSQLEAEIEPIELTNDNDSRNSGRREVNVLPKNKFLAKFGRIDTAPQNYYPDKGVTSTVCFDRSTIYNKPVVLKWLRTYITNDWNIWYHVIYNKYRYYFMGLRNQLFTEGRSEECHTRKYNELRPYLECALKRNQRMEYMIPMYPLHQIYFHHLTKLMPELGYH